MKNTTGLYKHQRDNQGKRRKLRATASRAVIVPVKKYDYEIARDADREMLGSDATHFDGEIGNK
jgi:hypothetical protein